ncbi:MAG: hypothetical protein FWD62_14510 [Betaproteobacteria bacterium]|nr:hypothetical protein [Betaproteobacteria bacterium]
MRDAGSFVRFELLRRVASAGFCALFVFGVAPDAPAATKHKLTHAVATQLAKPSKTSSKSTGKADAGKPASKKGTSGKHAEEAQKEPACHPHKGRKGKRSCAPPAERALSNSPINAKALEESGKPLDGAPVKARSVPIRAYAVDGATFFLGGRKYRIEGLGADTDAELMHDHAAQRLQGILDSGLVTTEALGLDENGVMRAVVRVNGRDVADLLRARP